MTPIETEAHAVAASAPGLDPITISFLMQLLMMLPCTKKFVDPQEALRTRYTNAGPATRRRLIRKLSEHVQEAEKLAAKKEGRRARKLTDDEKYDAVKATLEHGVASKAKTFAACMAAMPGDE